MSVARRKFWRSMKPHAALVGSWVVAVALLAGCSGDNGTGPDGNAPVSVVFEDDFEGGGCLDKWVEGGRQAEGTNIADCTEHNSSTAGHLFKSSFTEITLTPATCPWVYADDLKFDFDLRVRVYSQGSAPKNYYGNAEVRFTFLSEEGEIGKVSYLAATTSYPFDVHETDTEWAAIEIPTDQDKHFSLTVDDILANIPSVDRSAITGVNLSFSVYSSTRPRPYVEGEMWLDNVLVTGSSDI